MTQLSLLETKNKIDERFERFHQSNPHIYKQLVRLARQAHNRGLRKIGIKMLYEVLRWNSLIRTDVKDYKLSNDFTSRYARLIMNQEKDLDDIFELRELR